MDRPFPAYLGDEPYAFVSYAHRDAGVVYPELVWLNEHAVRVWYDEGIEVGSEWREEIALAIRNARLFLYYLTPASAASEHCRKELGFALNEGVPVLAVHLEETDLPPGLSMTLSDRQALMRYQLPASEYGGKLLTRVGALLGQSVVPRPAPPRPRNPRPMVAAVATVVVLAAIVMVATSIDFRSTDFWAGISRQDTSDPEQAGAEEAARLALEAARYSIAVLAFTNRSQDEESRVLALGLSEEVLDELAQKDLNVPSRTASFQASARADDIASIGAQLKVSYIVEGSVTRLHDDLRIAVQLIRVADGYQVWSKVYERIYTGDFQMQSDLADNIALQVSVRMDFDIFSTHGRREIPRFKGVNPVALDYMFDSDLEYRLYMLGEGGSIELYERYGRLALEAEPEFYDMLSGMANHYVNRLDNRRSYQETAPLAHAAFDKLIRLAPDHPWLPQQLGQLFLNVDWDYAGAEREFGRCLDMFPRAPWCHVFLAAINVREGRYDEAAAQLRAAAATEAGSEQGALMLVVGLNYLLMGNYDASLQSLARARRAVSAGPVKAYVLRTQALALVLSGDLEKGKTAIDAAARNNDSVPPALLGYLYALTGDQDNARRLLNEGRQAHGDAVWRAAGHLALGEIDKSFEFLRASINNHDMFVAEALRGPDIFAGLWSDPRFAETLALLDSEETHTARYLQAQR